MALLLVRVPPPFLPAALPTAQLGIGLLLILAVFRRPTRSLRPVWWYPALCAGVLAFAIVESHVNDVGFVRRAANIVLLMAMAGFLASGRIDVGSTLKGLGVALVLNAVLFYGGVAPDDYGGVLSGYLQDKNVAGLFYGAGALLVSMMAPRVWQRIAVLCAGAGGVILTDSRTSMAAYAAALVWLAVSPRLQVAFKAGLGIVICTAFFWVTQNLSTIGTYATERAGSDALRSRIDAAARLKAETTPWYGQGLGTATVTVDGNEWFFHNSYHGLWVEGGVVLFIAMLAIYVGAGFGVFPPRPAADYPWHATGAATVMVLLCATQLGEVFLAPIGFLVVGTALALIAQRSPYVGRSVSYGGSAEPSVTSSA